MAHQLHISYVLLTTYELAPGDVKSERVLNRGVPIIEVSHPCSVFIFLLVYVGSGRHLWFKTYLSRPSGFNGELVRN